MAVWQVQEAKTRLSEVIEDVTAKAPNLLPGTGRNEPSFFPSRTTGPSPLTNPISGSICWVDRRSTGLKYLAVAIKGGRSRCEWAAAISLDTNILSETRKKQANERVCPFCPPPNRPHFLSVCFRSGELRKGVLSKFDPTQMRPSGSGPG